MKYVQEQINRLDKKIEGLSASILKSHYDTLLNEFQTFERSINSLYSTRDTLTKNLRNLQEIVIRRYYKKKSFQCTPLS